LARRTAAVALVQELATLPGETPLEPGVVREALREARNAVDDDSVAEPEHGEFLRELGVAKGVDCLQVSWTANLLRQALDRLAHLAACRSSS
jgi:hypothetical protein